MRSLMKNQMHVQLPLQLFRLNSNWRESNDKRNKTLALCWQAPQSTHTQQWSLAFLDILNMEQSVARSHGAKQKNLNVLFDAAESV